MVTVPGKKRRAFYGITRTPAFTPLHVGTPFQLLGSPFWDSSSQASLPIRVLKCRSRPLHPLLWLCNVAACCSQLPLDCLEIHLWKAKVAGDCSFKCVYMFQVSYATNSLSYLSVVDGGAFPRPPSEMMDQRSWQNTVSHFFLLPDTCALAILSRPFSTGVGPGGTPLFVFISWWRWSSTLHGFSIKPPVRICYHAPYAADRSGRLRQPHV